MMQVDDENTIARVILAANELEKARSYRDGKKVAKELLGVMRQVEDHISAPIKLLLASSIIEAIHVAVSPTEWNQLANINLPTSYDLSKIVQLCIRWVSAQEFRELQSRKRIVMKIVEVINLWNQTFPNQPEVATIVSWPKRAYSLASVTVSELALPEHSVSFKINLNPQRRLRHATSTFNSMLIILGIMNQQITFKSSSNPSKRSTPVWCGVILEEEEIRDIPQESKRYLQQNRYGSVIFEFPMESTSRLNQNVAYVLGTREYIYEYSQAILIPESSNLSPPDDMYYVINDNDDGDQITPLSKIDNIKTFDWELSYSSNGKWTHPELVFPNDLKVNASQIKLSFAGHSCPTHKSEKCYDCKKNIRTKETARNHFKQLMNDCNWTQHMKFTLGSAFSSDDYDVLFGS